MQLINNDAIVCVNSKPICKCLLQKHETVPFTRVNVAALDTQLKMHEGH